ncbi:TPA: DNA primase, partial [Campylobacter fetus subsp. venerealis]|nr:DNA primase [Campylobacter fetus subsp. venerealis]
EKDRAKSAGAKWDRESKMWYAPKGADLNKLSTWLNPQEQNLTNNVFNEFKNALNEAGLIIENEPIMDGKLHRVKTTGDKGRELSGAYVGFLNGHPAGFIQNFKTGFKENWKSNFSNLTNKNQEIEIKNTQENNNALKVQRE